MQNRFINIKQQVMWRHIYIYTQLLASAHWKVCYFADIFWSGGPNIVLLFLWNCIHVSLLFLQISMRNSIGPLTPKTVIKSLVWFWCIVVYVSCVIGICRWSNSLVQRKSCHYMQKKCQRRGSKTLLCTDDHNNQFFAQKDWNALN